MGDTSSPLCFLQAAAEQLTKKDAASNSQRLHAEATQDAVTRCVEVSFVVGFWVALSAVAAVGQFLNPPPPEEVLLQQQQAMAAAAAAAAEGAGRPGGAVVLEPTVPSGGIFGQMFGLSAGVRERPAAHPARSLFPSPLPSLLQFSIAPASVRFPPAADHHCACDEGARASGRRDR